MNTWSLRVHGCGACRIPAARRGYWEGKLGRNRARDLKNRRALNRRGWGVMVVWECQTRNRAALAERIERFLRGG